MYDPNSAIPESAKPALWRRYDDWRGERHRNFVRRNARRMPQWRTRRGYRTVVCLQLACIVVLLAGAITAFVSKSWFLLPFILGVGGIIICQRILRIITGSIGDAPVTALDEIQLAQRNSARSIAFFALFSLMFIPYLLLIALSLRDTVSGNAVYGVAVVTISLMLVAGVLPSMLTAWWMADADPEDFSENDSSTADPTNP